MLFRIQAWINFTPDADRLRLGAQNLWGAPDLLSTHALLCEK